MRRRNSRAPEPRAFAAFGVTARVELEDPELWPVVEEILPPGRVACEPSQASLRFALRASDSNDYTVLIGETAWLEHATLDVAVHALDQQLRLFVAANAPDVIFVHAGVVAMDGRALVIPGGSFSGKTTLVKALVECGATYYSDEYAVLDAEGRIHPYPRRLSIRGQNGERLREQPADELGALPSDETAELAVVAITRYRPSAEWRPEGRSGGNGIAALLANAVPAQERPRESLQAIGRAVRGARILEGDRGDVAAVAPRLLEELARARSTAAGSRPRVTNETCEVAFEAFGAGVVVRTARDDLAARVRDVLPPEAHERDARPGDAEFAIEPEADDSYRVSGPDPEEEPFRAPKLDGAIERLRADLAEHIAARSPDHLFVRGGAVALGGRAIVLPGEPEAETSALVAALVRNGATFYADGYVPLDGSGHVNPYRLGAPPTADGERRVGQAPARVAIVATIARREGTSLGLRDGTAEDGVLTLLRHGRGADGRPEVALRAARAATEQALMLEGERDSADAAAAALIERLAHVPRGRSPERREPASPVPFENLVLGLESELIDLAGTLERAGVDAVLLNGEEVRPALAHRFAFSFSAVIELPRAQATRALGAMEAAGWQPMGGGRDGRYFRRGVVVRLRPRGLSLPAFDRGPVAKGRFGFDEPATHVTDGQPEGPLEPMPFDPGGPLRTGLFGAVLQAGAEALTVLDTKRLRGRESEFRGLPIQFGPGVHAFEVPTGQLVDAVLARLPDASGVRVVEVGTGTAAVALSVARERPDAEVLATDVSLRALGWARRNRRRLGMRNVRLAQGSLLAPVPPTWRGGVAAIAINPPMALPATGVELRGVREWPVGTATGPGADGLGLVRALARDAREVLAAGGYLHLHLLAHQASWIATWLEELGYEAAIPADAASQPYTVEIPARWPGPDPTPDPK